MTQTKKQEKVFRSPSSGVMCSAAQYIAEIMCLRKAEKENKGNLPLKFWNTEKRKKSYQGQIVATQRIIAEFGEEVLLAFINSDSGKFVYSLGFFTPIPFIKDKIANFAKTYKPREITISEPVEKIDVNAKPAPVFNNKKSKFSKLKELEKKNGENKSI